MQESSYGDEEEEEKANAGVDSGVCFSAGRRRRRRRKSKSKCGLLFLLLLMLMTTMIHKELLKARMFSDAGFGDGVSSGEGRPHFFFLQAQKKAKKAHK